MLVCNEVPVLSGVSQETHARTQSTTMSALSWRGGFLKGMHAWGKL